MRVLVLLLLFALAARAQGPDARIERALDPLTAGKERVRLLDEIAATEEGADKLAAAGLVSGLDPGVVGDVVAVLFEKNRYADHLEAICRLLLSDAHRAVVERRLIEAGSVESTRTALVDGLAPIAGGENPAPSSDPQLRRAGVRALACIPWRRAVRLIVDVWLKDDEDRAVREECRVALKGVLQVRSAAEADRELRAHPWDDYFTLMRRRSRGLYEKLERLRKFQLMAMSSATAEQAFESADDADTELRLGAAARLLKLAGQAQYGALGAEGFAKRSVEVFVSEREREDRDAKVLASHCELLRALWGDDAQAPLRKTLPASDVAALVAPLSGADESLRPAGEAAVRLLGEIGEEAKQVLAEFARGFGDAAVRTGAIQYLGQLAARSGTSADWIGRRLAEILGASTGVPEVRRQLLAMLATKFEGVPQAFGPVTALLAKGAGSASLTAGESRYCIEILRKIGSDEARATLFGLAADASRDVETRIRVVEEGLLAWARANGHAAQILEQLRKLALDPSQPEAFRIGIVERLGKSRLRTAHEVLVTIGRTAGLAAPLVAAAHEAELALAESLVLPSDGAAPSREDLVTAIRILEEERERDPERIGSLARAIVTAGDEARVPVGIARYCLADAYRRRLKDEADKKELRRLLRAAADKAHADQLAPAHEERLLVELRALLVEAGDDAGAAARSRRLAELAGSNRLKAAAYLLDAAESALAAGDGALAKTLLDQITTVGPLEGELEQRRAALEKKLATPAPPPDGT